jgi:hypothetical protein
MKEPLENLLAKLRDALRADTDGTRSHLLPGAGCFSWSRFLGAARNNDWAAAEQGHVTGCAYCKQMAENAVRSLRDIPEEDDVAPEIPAESDGPPANTPALDGGPAGLPEPGHAALPPANTPGQLTPPR